MGEDEYRARAERERNDRVKKFADALLDSNAESAFNGGACSNDKAEKASEQLAKDEAAAVLLRSENDDVRLRMRELAEGIFEVAAETAHSGHRKRLREKLESLNDLDLAEADVLLEAFLAYLIPRKDVQPLAKKLLERFDGSLWNVIHAEPDELKTIPSMTGAAARELSELSRALRESEVAEVTVACRDDALELFASLNAGDDITKTHVAYLDGDFRVLGVETFRGDSPVDPKLIVSGAYRRSASAVIIGRRDSKLLPQWQGGAQYADMLREVLATVRVMLLDVIVFTGLGYYSLGLSSVRNDVAPVYVFTPLVTMRDASAIIRSTPEEEEET